MTAPGAPVWSTMELSAGQWVEAEASCAKKVQGFSHWRHTVDFLTSASKFNIETNGRILDVSPKNDRASPNVKIPLHAHFLMRCAVDAGH